MLRSLAGWGKSRCCGGHRDGEPDRHGEQFQRLHDGLPERHGEQPGHGVFTATRSMAMTQIVTRQRCYPMGRSSHPARVLTVGEVSALSDLDNVTVRVADVAAYLPVLGDRLRDELGSSTFP